MPRLVPNLITILAATKNTHKLSEFNAMLYSWGFSVESAFDRYEIPSVPESGATFEENAIVKATSVAHAINETVFADDSGLEVESLGGAPGIYSARYAGENATDQDRVNKLLKQLEGHSNRNARFVCVIAVVSPARVIGTTQGIVEGRIAMSPKGDNGFGYDPVFVPQHCEQTMAELNSKEKNAISHRYRALASAVEKGMFTPHQ